MSLIVSSSDNVVFAREGRKREYERGDDEEVRAAALPALQAPVDEAAEAGEVLQLQEELQRVKLAGKWRFEQKSDEVIG